MGGAVGTAGGQSILKEGKRKCALEFWVFEMTAGVLKL